jgi:glycosyltransferase involved in cell wall biosynthesis
MPKLVTIGIPVYKRLEYLPQALTAVHLQDYSNIELIVSDNGMNGSKVTDIVDKYYSRPYRFRQSASSISVVPHFNQIINEASGEYFVLLSDDDEISPNYISDLVDILDHDPKIIIAFSKQEVMDQYGNTTSVSNTQLPSVMTGEDFIQAWCFYKLGFKNLLTNMSRTKDIKMSGGFPDFPRAIHSDDALPLKLCLNNYVAFSQRCTFRYRVYEASLGLSSDYRDLAEASKQFLKFLDSDPKILAFASVQPDRWHQLKRYVTKLTWQTYFSRWKKIYRKTLPPLQWIRAAFVLPFIPAYYRAVTSTLIHLLKSAASTWAQEYFPRAYEVYRTLKKATCKALPS